MKVKFQSGLLIVGLPGFEPGKSGPESEVLPLHHSPIFRLQRYNYFKYQQYFILFFEVFNHTYASQIIISEY